MTLTEFKYEFFRLRCNSDKQNMKKNREKNTNFKINTFCVFNVITLRTVNNIVTYITFKCWEKVVNNNRAPCGTNGGSTVLVYTFGIDDKIA